MKRALLLLLVLPVAVAGSAGATNDTYFGQQWAIGKMHVESAWRVSRGAGVVVAVIDTGVDLKHPDLKGKVLPGIDYVDGDESPQDQNGHGTHMAGTIAAVTSNDLGVASVARDAKILPVRVLNEKGESEDAVTVGDAIRWAADEGAQIINLSLAADGTRRSPSDNAAILFASSAIDLAIRYADSQGAVVVIASGNTESGGKSQTAYDATVPGAIVVGASTTGDKRAAYSNYGAGLDVLAPGGGSAVEPGFESGCSSENAVVGLYWDPDTKPSDYAGACGTSVAVAQVSGVAALLAARGLSNDAIVERIKATTVDLGPRGRDDQTGYGRIDAARAVGAPTGSPAPRRSEPAGSQPPVGRVGAAASAQPSVSPGPSSSSPAPGSKTLGRGPSRDPSAAPPIAPVKDRSRPIAIATVLAMFVSWAHSIVRRRGART